MNDDDDLRTRIAEVIGVHEVWQHTGRIWECACGRTFSLKVDCDIHVADAVIRDLAILYVSKAAMMTEIQSYATDHENLGLAESAQDLIDTAAEWDQWK